MDKNIVLTLEIPEYEWGKDEAKKVLSGLISMLEAFGVEVVGKIHYEEVNDEQEM